MANKKVISAIAIASTVLVAGSAFAVAAATTDFLSPNAADAHNLVWESEPTLVGEKLIMYGDEHGEIEVKSTNAVEGGKVLALGENGSFENVSPIGRISRIALTYTVGASTENFIGDDAPSKVLKAQFGYMVAPNNPTVYFKDATEFANDWNFNYQKPSFVRFISTTKETIKINKIEISYGCKDHDYVDVLAQPGLYVVGEGSFVKHNCNWTCFGGTMLEYVGNDGGQNQATIAFKKGDKFSFKNAEGNWFSYQLQGGDNEWYKHNGGDDNIEILKDCNLGIYLKDEKVEGTSDVHKLYLSASAL